MAQYKIQGSTLTDIADSIRSISGTSNQMTAAEMQNELDGFNSDITQVLNEQDSLISQLAETIAAIDSEKILISRDLVTYTNDIATTVGYKAFADCTSLTTVNFPNVTSISAHAFSGCTSLTNLTLGASTVCKLAGTNAFTNTPIESGSGHIYVPASLMASYKANTIWRNFSSCFSDI